MLGEVSLAAQSLRQEHGRDRVAHAHDRGDLVLREGRDGCLGLGRGRIDVGLVRERLRHRRIGTAALSNRVDHALRGQRVGSDLGHDDAELSDDRVSCADRGVNDLSSVVRVLADELLAVVLGDEIGRLRAVHRHVVPERPEVVVVALVEGRTADRDDPRVGPDREHVRVERGDPDHRERMLVHHLLRGGEALVVVGRCRRAITDDLLGGPTTRSAS